MIKKIVTLLGFLLVINSVYALPAGFVYLQRIDPSIVQDMRYASDHNFIGRPIQGYQRATCILTLPTALALQHVQHELNQQGMSLKVFDCYRPQVAVEDFYQWSRQPSRQAMKMEFYPRVDKRDFFDLGYVARHSGHSRGSTVDLTIVPLQHHAASQYHPGQKLVACYAPQGQRFHDGSIDMGTGFDCLDETAHRNATNLTAAALNNRQVFQQIMEKYGFVPYDKEWWHYTLKNEPYPDTYFNFPVA